MFGNRVYALREENDLAEHAEIAEMAKIRNEDRQEDSETSSVCYLGAFARILPVSVRRSCGPCALSEKSCISQVLLWTLLNARRKLQ
jgi:hypothetical protein